MKIYLKTPVSYYGGKQMMLKEILPLIPEHKLYCETFCGGAAVFWAKEPSKVEVINDTNTEVINFYRVLKLQFNELFELVQSSIHSRQLYEDARTICNNPHLFSDVQRAWAFWINTSQSFASIIGGGWAYARKENTCEKKVDNAKIRFQEVYNNRLNRVQIECNDALKVIKSRDSEETFFYCDPPYVDTDQGHYGGYTQLHFNVLLEALSKIKGKFLLSSFPNSELNNYAQQHGWIQTEHSKALCATKNKRGQKKIEVLTRNYNL